jgi:thiamine biosynthesis lipoprotein
MTLCIAVFIIASARAEPMRFAGPTMGTAYHVRFVQPDATKVDAQRLQQDVEQMLREVDEQMSTYRDDSALSRFNRSPAGKWFPVSAATAHVVAFGQEISRKTDGALDVTVGPLLALWRFSPDEPAAKNARKDFTPPSTDLIEATRAKIGYKNLEVRTEPPALRKRMDGIEVDLSSIAPGYAVDRMYEILRERGVRDFMVEIGGEVRACGTRDDGKPWRVAIERPRVGRREMQMAVPLVDAAISTAGDYRKYFEHDGRRYSHIIDPAAGRPVQHDLASVTVIADTCIAADGWDTALLVMGPERGFEFAEQNTMAALFIARGADKVNVRATRAWQTRFED